MPVRKELKFPVLSADLQVAFYYRLAIVRERYLQRALRAAVLGIPVAQLDDELREIVPPHALQRVASFGLRGEVFFPAPILLQRVPYLLGYYRLLYGISQKEFYNKGPFGRFRKLEDRGVIPQRVANSVVPLCRSLGATGSKLVDGLDQLSLDIIRDLQLLTVGPQLRGSENTRIGESAIQTVVDLIVDVVGPHVKERTRRSIRIENAARRPVLIQIASDPDVLITEKLGDGFRYIMSIEVKGGSDASNILNRLGEAEKSPLKAKNLGCVELWTITRVDVPVESARRASPTTTAFD